MSEISRSMDSPDRSTVETVRPERRTVTRSEISATSSMRCEMNRMAVPSAASRRISTKSRSRELTSREAVDSSRMRTLGLRTSARAMQRDCRSESESCPAGRSSGISPAMRVSTSWAIDRCSARASRRRNVPWDPSQTFSRTDWLPAVRTSWNTVAIPRSMAARGDRLVTGTPSNVTVPESGRWTPPMILTRVLLPEPFSPRSVWISPGRRCRSPSMRARVAPKRLLTPASTRPDGWLFTADLL